MHYIVDMIGAAVTGGLGCFSLWGSGILHADRHLRDSGIFGAAGIGLLILSTLLMGVA